MYDGWVGVDLFFVISGFLITNILVGQKGKKNFFLNFYSRRSIRIFPLYYIVILFAAVLMYLFKSADKFSELPYYFFYVQNIHAVSTRSYIYLLAHTWSLCIEEQFYLIWPLIIYLCSIKRSFYVTIFLILLAVFMRHYFATHDYGIYYQSTLLITRMDSLLVGGLIVLFVHEYKNLQKTFLNRISNIVGLVSILSLVILLFFFGTDHSSVTSRFITGYKNFHNESLSLSFGHLKFTALALLFGCIIAKIAFNTSRYSERVIVILEKPVLNSIGKISYGIYIYHWVIFALIDAVNTKLHVVAVTQITSYGIFIIKLFLTLVVAQLSWKFIEAPINKLKDKFTY